MPRCGNHISALLPCYEPDARPISKIRRRRRPKKPTDKECIPSNVSSIETKFLLEIFVAGSIQVVFGWKSEAHWKQVKGKYVTNCKRDIVST
ncbi:hypothetical protein CDAR_194681 [Caerostris darwini]|uniref:Uncharacterized protein n=1 Tax=Caerostris darwini TaxID=1538125 RepID=A0AAV4X5D9_9ARAC|nr:hypothetical protein CDAR_194681 [Caerostris darwini]